MQKNPFLGKLTRIAKEHAHAWVRCSLGPGWPSERSYFRCAGEGCSQEVSYARVKKFHYRLCVKCYRQRASIKGIYIQDPWIWKNKDKYSHAEYRGNQVIHWMLCQEAGCTNPCVAARSKLTGTFICRPCARKKIKGKIRIPYATRIWRILAARHDSRGQIISEAQLEALLNIGHCGYCLKKINAKTKSGATSIDRMNNNLGYTASNVVTCCKICNSSKNANTNARDMLIFQLAARGNYIDASAVMHCSNYEDGLASIKRSGFADAARRILSGLSQLRRFQ